MNTDKTDTGLYIKSAQTFEK